MNARRELTPPFASVLPPRRRRVWLRRRCGQRGTAATELAFVLPVFALMALATVDLGRFAHSYIGVSNATRAGAEYGATHQVTMYTRPTWEAAVREVMSEELEGAGEFGPEGVAVVIDVLEQAGAPPRIVVQSMYDFELIFHWPGLPQSIPMDCEVSMQQYR